MSKSIAELRHEYALGALSESDVDPDPIKQFERWLREAMKAQLPEPNAMTLATADRTGRPYARVVLLKDCDADGFVFFTKRNFVTLQAAWDRSDIATLRSMMTDGMLEEIRAQLAERESQRGAEPNHTDVVMIEAQLLGIEEMDDRYMASVEFSGMIREELSAGPSPFREVWNMTKSKSGNGGWLVAGVQALQ